MANEEVPEEYLKKVVDDGFVGLESGRSYLTDKGIDEKNRLCTLAGLNIRYLSERNEQRRS